MTLQTTHFIVGTGAGVGVCGVVECDTAGVGHVVAVVGSTIFLSLSSGDFFPSRVTYITCDVSSRDVGSLRHAFLHCHDRRRKKEGFPVTTAITKETEGKQEDEDPPIAASKEEEDPLPLIVASKEANNKEAKEDKETPSSAAIAERKRRTRILLP